MLLRVDIDVDHLFFFKNDPCYNTFVFSVYENKSSNGTQRHSAKTS